MKETRVSSTKWFGLALQSLLVLADFDGIAPSGALADKLGAKSSFLRKVLSNLVKAGILSAKEGRDGGYYLAKEADDITLAEVYEAMRTDPYAKGFLDVNKEECFAPGTQKALAGLIDEMENWLLQGLSEKTVGDLLRDR
ncbi:RrF2 family transcriptional regulator [Fictibacillus aquaticus]|uniref:Transcriptional regulator n=1 Tax=Fictibacillus aquaticus TaxID=2021314 RepID=A0A235F844_9BACL|nr:Rrf2 family transcriptional regulator [Fictibacillus aquaticus]OYD57157.1 transcriptional regulator [Fictibacillus aquaticus]